MHLFHPTLQSSTPQHLPSRTLYSWPAPSAFSLCVVTTFLLRGIPPRGSVSDSYASVVVVDVVIASASGRVIVVVVGFVAASGGAMGGRGGGEETRVCGGEPAPRKEGDPARGISKDSQTWVVILFVEGEKVEKMAGEGCGKRKGGDETGEKM